MPHDVEPRLPEDAIERGTRALVQEGAWANAVGGLGGGVVLVGFALALGASSTTIGILGAIPFLTQVAQLPAINLIETVRRRRPVAVVALTAGRVVILAIGLAAFVLEPGDMLVALVAGQVLLGLLGATGTCAWNAWIHDLLPRSGLGSFFARRLVWATGFGMAAGLGAGLLAEHWPGAARTDAFAVLFVLAGACGFVSSWWLARVPEPPMAPGTGRRIPYATVLGVPLGDPNFRRLIHFMVAWNVATNVAAPFFAVFLIRQLGFGLGLVMALTVSSQIANMLTLRGWGRLSDRFSNKSVLGIAAPLFLGCVVSLPFVAVPERHLLTVPMLVVVHVLMGAASAGVGLATGNIALKLAPHGRASLYLASNSLFSALAAGLAPIAGGLSADWFAARELIMQVEWLAPSGSSGLTLVRFQHWDFFFVTAFVIGLYALHRLTLVREEGTVSETVVVAELAMAGRRAMRSLSTAAGLRLAFVFPFGRPVRDADLRARRLRGRGVWSAGETDQLARRREEAGDPGGGVPRHDAEAGEQTEGDDGDPHVGPP